MMVEFWLGGVTRVVHDVPAKAVEDCYSLPRKGPGSDRFAYWRQITGDERIAGPMLVWSVVEKRNVGDPAHT